MMLLSATHSILSFFVGVVSTILLSILWKLCRNLLVSRKVKEGIQEDLNTLDITSDLDIKAASHVRECKNRLMLQRKINPDWIEPLKTEIPSLVRNIAQTYFPEEKNPLLSPDLTEFICALELVSNDISAFLQSRMGRMLNVSGNTAHETYKIIQNISTNERLVRLDHWYRKFRPVFQVLYYKSSLMWTFMIGRNIAVRTLQAKIVSIVGARVIQLYSGKLKNGTKP